jgi:hypothetical protein
MTILASYFADALKNIEPEDDKENAATAHKKVSKALTEDLRLQKLGINPILIGSYKRNVSIRRVKDVDVFARLDKADEDLSPGEILDLFEEILADEKNFGKDRVERQDRSIKVEFPDFNLTVDAVPARPRGDHWEIPNKPEDAERAQWIETNPLKLNDLTEEANGKYLLNGEGIYVPTVKLVRQVRRTWIKDHPGGLFFEIMTYWAFINNDLKAGSVAEYLTLTLEGVVDVMQDVVNSGLDDPTLPDNKITTKASDDDLSNALSRIQEAAALARQAFEDEDDCMSAAKWRTLLGKSTDDGDVFPLPSYCNPDGTKKIANYIVRGATTVPAGNDRYA